MNLRDMSILVRMFFLKSCITIILYEICRAVSRCDFDYLEYECHLKLSCRRFGFLSTLIYVSYLGIAVQML